MSTQHSRTRAAILLEGVRRTHPGAGQPTLDGLDLRVDDGEFVALTGESGSGKSTIIGLCSGRQQADAGNIRILGRDITRIGANRRAELRRRVATIFQEYELLPDRTIGENIAFTLEINGIPGEERRRRVDEALELVGLPSRREALPEQLSGGEQQRVAVARAVALRPSIILADEPTGNLDEENGELIFDLLSTLNQAGTTVLVTSHDVNLVTRLGLRTLRIHDGRVRTYRRHQAGR
ncbi:MAG: ABC transporter ATP-binding protein [Acidobacteria bacterium]|nr:ABC transporter ATP-binding protein [Acidobacteriota bacterium]